MLEKLPVAPPDSILGLADVFGKDPRPDKVNLTVGVYKDEQGQTPILASVKKAESRLLQDEKSKGYLGIDASGNSIEMSSISCSGLGRASTGSCRAIGGWHRCTSIGSRVDWHAFIRDDDLGQSTTWLTILRSLKPRGTGSQLCVPRPCKTGLDLDGMIATLRKEAKAGDMVCLHACCHNPTGIDPTPEAWSALADLMAKKELIPFLLDFAYQGFGDGLKKIVIA